MPVKDKEAVDLTFQQIAALLVAIDAELRRMEAAKYEVGIEGVTHYDERMVKIRTTERLLRNARKALLDKGGDKLREYLKGVGIRWHE
jgi:hypothetical protein